MIEQFIPQEVCLKCKGCCRYSQENSVWAPCLLDEEIQGLLDKNKKIPPASITADRRIHPVLIQDTAIRQRIGAEFICPFLEIQQNSCKIYDFRPFECQLYPFLLCIRDKKVLLTLDLNCPYIEQNLSSEKLKEYTKYLSNFLNSPKQLKILKENPQILQAYENELYSTEIIAKR